MRKYTCLLPRAKRKDSHMTQSRQTVFGGLSSAVAPQGHEITHMSGLSAMTYPAMGTMETRFAYDVSSAAGEPYGLYHHDTPVMVKGTGLYEVAEDGALSRLATLDASPKTLASFGSLLFILPDRLVYDTAQRKLRSLSLHTGAMTDAYLGTNYVTYSTLDWESAGFAVGDGVAISIEDYILGSTTVFHRKIVDMNAGTLFLDSDFERTGTFKISVYLDVPELMHVCTLGDRLMGCHENTVYLSEAGNPFNWCVQNGTDADPVSMKIAGAGDITACIAYRECGYFFKENCICRITGQHASDLMLTVTSAPGVSEDSAKSLCEVGGALYYLASGGVYRFDGDYPTPVGQALSQGLTGGVGGTDGICYYLSATDAAGESRMYAYRPDLGLWFVQDALAVHAMTTVGDRLFIQTDAGELLYNAKRGEALPTGQTKITEAASVIMSEVIFGDTHGNTPDGLRLHGIHLRAAGEEQATMLVEVSYDGGAWEQVGSLSNITEGTVHIPVYPHRARAYRLRLLMSGRWLISEITCDVEKGKQ